MQILKAFRNRQVLGLWEFPENEEMEDLEGKLKPTFWSSSWFLNMKINYSRWRWKSWLVKGPLLSRVLFICLKVLHRIPLSVAFGAINVSRKLTCCSFVKPILIGNIYGILKLIHVSRWVRRQNNRKAAGGFLMYVVQHIVLHFPNLSFSIGREDNHKPER